MRAHTHTHRSRKSQRARRQSSDLSRLWPVWVKQSKSWTQMSSWLLKVHTLSFTFFSISCSLALLTPPPRLLRRLTDNQGRREEEENRGRRDGGGEWGRGTCDVPTQGYLIPSVRGERLSCSVWLWQIKEAVQILARSRALSSWVDLTRTHMHTHIQCTQTPWCLA